jgi:hypothetical protein
VELNESSGSLLSSFLYAGPALMPRRIICRARYLKPEISGEAA